MIPTACLWLQSAVVIAFARIPRGTSLCFIFVVVCSPLLGPFLIRFLFLFVVLLISLSLFLWLAAALQALSRGRRRSHPACTVDLIGLNY